MGRRGNRCSVSFTLRNPGVFIPLGVAPSGAQYSPIPPGNPASSPTSHQLLPRKPYRPLPFFPRNRYPPPFLLGLSGHPFGLPALCWPKAGTAGTAGQRSQLDTEPELRVFLHFNFLRVSEFQFLGSQSPVSSGTPTSGIPFPSPEVNERRTTSLGARPQ